MTSEEKKIRAYLATIGLDYNALTKEEFVSIISRLKKYKHLKVPSTSAEKHDRSYRTERAKRNANKEKSAPAFKAGADFCYPIMRLNFWRKWRKFGVNSLLRIQKIKQFQGFAANLSTCRPCRRPGLRLPWRRRPWGRACRRPEIRSSGRRRRWTRRSPERCA